jgi:hypothetical protein
MGMFSCFVPPQKKRRDSNAPTLGTAKRLSMKHEEATPERARFNELLHGLNTWRF